LILLLCTGAMIQAQDKFYLRNGSLVKGRYIHKLSTDTTIHVALEGGYIVIPQATLAYAKFKRHYGTEDDGNERVVPKVRPPGFYGALSAGINIGSHSTYYNTVKPFVESLFGYRWDKVKNVGGGISFDGYERYYAVPMYVHYEYDIGYQNFHPYLYGNAGYGHVWEKHPSAEGVTVKGGRYLAIGFGYKIRAGNNDIRLSLGFKSQQANLKVDENLIWGFSSRKQNMNRVVAKVGFTF